MSTQFKNIPCGAVRVLTLISLISAAFGASAQGALTQDEKWLAPVMVTASRFEQEQTEALQHVTVITEEDIQRSQAVDLPSLLRRQAGVQISQNGGPGSTTGMFLRGTATLQTLILVDGIPMTKQDATGTLSFGHIMLSDIERVEIVRGNVSAVYGSGAIGGVIQIFTKSGKGEPRFNVEAEGGSRDSGRLSAGVSGGAERFTYAFSASRVKTDGFSAQNPAQNPGADNDKDGYTNTSASGQMGYELAKGHELGFRFMHSDGDVEYDQGASDKNAVTRLGTQTVYLKNRLNASWGSDFAVSRITDKYDDFTNRAWDSSAHTKTKQILWNNSFALSSDWTANAGIEHRDEAIDVGSAWDTYGKSRTVKAAFAGLIGKVAEHSLQINARHDDYSDADSASTGYLGYGYEFMPGYKAIASYSTSFLVAPLGYLYSGSGNPDLRPEEVAAREFGLQYAKGSTFVKVVAFDSRVKNQLHYSFDTWAFVNIPQVRNEGIELSFNTNVSGFELNSFITVQDPIDEGTQQTLSRRAHKLASVGLSKTFGTLSLGTDWQYTGKRTDKLWNGDRELESYVVGNLTARYAIGKNTTLFGRIENVTDKDYQTAYGFNQAPRSFFVGLNWQQ